MRIGSTQPGTPSVPIADVSTAIEIWDHSRPYDMFGRIHSGGMDMFPLGGGGMYAWNMSAGLLTMSVGAVTVVPFWTISSQVCVPPTMSLPQLGKALWLSHVPSAVPLPRADLDVGMWGRMVTPV